MLKISVCVDTKADMITLSSSLDDGSFVSTKGYHTVGDAGANNYEYHSTGRPASEDGGFVVFGGGADDWFEAVDQTVSRVKQFGCRMDGSDDTTAFQAAIDAASRIEIPVGTLTCGNITIPSFKFVRGGGRDTIIKMKTMTTGEFVSMKDTGNCEHTTIQDLKINGFGNEGQTGLLMEATYQCVIKNVWIDEFRDSSDQGIGLLIVNKSGFNSSRCEFINLLIDNSDLALRLDSVDDQRSTGYHKFHGLNLGLERSGIELLSTSQNGSINNLFSGVMFQDSQAVAGDFHKGTAQNNSGSTTSIKLDSGADATTVDIYKGARIFIVSGSAAEELTTITAYDHTTRIATVSPAFATAPDSTSEFILSKRFHVYCEGSGNTFVSTIHDNSAGVDYLMAPASSGNRVINPSAGDEYHNLQSSGAANQMDDSVRRGGGWGKGQSLVLRNIDGDEPTAVVLDATGLSSTSKPGGEVRFATDESSIHYRMQVSRQDSVGRLNFLHATGGTLMYLYGPDEATKFPKAVAAEFSSQVVAASQTSVDVSGTSHLSLTAAASESISTFSNGMSSHLLFLTTGANVQLVNSSTIKLNAPHSGTLKTNWVFLSNNSGEYLEMSRSEDSTAYGAISTETNSTATTISSASTDFSNKVQVAFGTTNSTSQNTTPDHTSDDITIDLDGDYSACISLSVSGTASDVISFALFKNGTTQLGPRSTITLSGGVDSVHFSPGPAPLVATDTLEVWVQNETAGRNITVEDASFHVVKIN